MIKKTDAENLIRNNLGEIMLKRGIGVRELARESQNSAMTISRLKTDGRLPSVDCLLRITEYLGITVEDLFADSKKTEENAVKIDEKPIKEKKSKK